MSGNDQVYHSEKSLEGVPQGVSVTQVSLLTENTFTFGEFVRYALHLPVPYIRKAYEEMEAEQWKRAYLSVLPFYREEWFPTTMHTNRLYSTEYEFGYTAFLEEWCNTIYVKDGKNYAVVLEFEHNPFIRQDTWENLREDLLDEPVRWMPRFLVHNVINNYSPTELYDSCCYANCMEWQPHKMSYPWAHYGNVCDRDFE